MELISQHTKAIMEGCKERARAAGLRFDAESLEYIVTNRDLLELTPKAMIPTLYDYWVHDVEVLREKGRYELYPNNPYETVINTRPAISFYNDNNPDWLNVMIFYHVLAHIDFFQNNLFFRHTWDFDLAGQALADKRLIARLRAEKGRWVDYIIEFARGIDNLVGYHRELSRQHRSRATQTSARLDYYFDVFLQTERKLRPSDYLAEITRYNDCLKKYGKEVERYFFADVLTRHPEFDSLYDKSLQQHDSETKDLLQFLLDHSPMLQREENKWMKSVIDVVRKTSLYFQPQIRTKIMNEGWASYWHEKLFLQDERIKGHEIEFARIHAGVTSLQRVGLNPYAVGLRMFQSIEDAANKGRFDDRYRRLQNARARRDYDAATGNGLATIFRVREDYADFTFVNEFVDQEFVDRHKLFVVGRRLNEARMVWEYYVKSRSAEAYRQMLMENIYHPPAISVDRERTAKGPLYLNHRFENRPLVQEFIGNTLIGIEYLWGGSVQLETSEVARISRPEAKPGRSEPPAEITWRRVIYQSAQRKLTKVPA